MKASRYEAAWIGFAIFASLLFVVISGVYAFAAGFHVPHDVETVDPTNLRDTFGEPRVVEVVPGEKYEAWVIARQFSFIPDPIEIPAGAELVLHATSADVTHGIQIIDSNVNVMVLPGYVATVSATFEKPGEYAIICHEYCGTAHQIMRGKLIVKGRQ